LIGRASVKARAWSAAVADVEIAANRYAGLKKAGEQVMANERLYIVNYGSTALEKLVRSQSGEDLKVTVGPKSFVTVNTRAVSGALPWQVGDATGSHLTAVITLPAVAAFEPNVLTAHVAYPMR
jgi:hypothetical protein